VPEVAAADAQAPSVLTFDVGTSSVRALLYDARANAIAGSAAQLSHEMTTTPDGGVFCDAAALFDRTATAIDRALATAGDAGKQIAAVASDTFWHNVLGVDADGAAITPVYTWADTRSDAAATQLRHELDERAVHARTGCMIHPMYLPAKLRWLADAEPDAMCRAKYWMSFAEYFAFRCFGRRACSLSMASGTGLLDLNGKTWDETVLAALPINGDQLSPLVDVDEPMQGLSPEFARRWPALANLPWYPSIGDGAASNIGSGGVDDERIAINAGTSTAMRLVIRAASVTVPDGLWAYRVDGSHFVVGGAESNGGNVWAWLNERLRLADEPTVERAIAAMLPDSHGLTVLPFLAGERSPNYNARARGAITGMHLDTTGPEIARAFIEAMSYRLGFMHRIIADAYPQAKEIIVSGSALLHSAVWMQILADVLGKPLVVSGEAEATSRGAALIALANIGALRSWADAPAPLGAMIQPNMAVHRVYCAAMERQQRLYDAVVPPRTAQGSASVGTECETVIGA